MAANAELPANKSRIGGALAAQAPSGQNRLTGVPRALRRHRDRHITHVLQPVLDGRCLRTAAILKEAERDSLAYLDSHRRTRSPVHQQRPGADEPRDRARIEGDADIPPRRHHWRGWAARCQAQAIHHRSSKRTLSKL